MTERLQKLLAGAGHGSRRGIEEWIRAGRVTINDRVAVLGDRATRCRPDLPRWQATRSGWAPRIGRGAAVSQARGRGDHAQRSGEPADGVRATAAAGERALDRGWQAGREYLRAAAVHQRWGAGAPAHAPLERDPPRVPRAASRLAAGRGARAPAAGASSSRTGRRISMRSTSSRPRAATPGCASVCTKDAIARCAGSSNTKASMVSRLTRLRYGSVELPRDLRGGAFKTAAMPPRSPSCRVSRLRSAVSLTSDSLPPCIPVLPWPWLALPRRTPT